MSPHLETAALLAERTEGVKTHTVEGGPELLVDAENWKAGSPKGQAEELGHLTWP